MNIPIKTADEIEKMREAGRQAASVLEMIAPHVAAGVTTGEIDRLCHEYIVNDFSGCAGFCPPSVQDLLNETLF